MDFKDIPTWAWGAGAIVIVLALLQRSSAGQQATVTTVGPVANPNAQADVAARTAGFDKLVGFATDTAQLDVTRETTLAQIGAQTATAQAATAAQVRIATINAGTESQRIAAAQQTSNTQTASQLAAQRSANKTSTWNTVIGTVGSVIGGALKIFGL
jgi:hypothetical protein